MCRLFVVDSPVLSEAFLCPCVSQSPLLSPSMSKSGGLEDDSIDADESSFFQLNTSPGGPQQRGKYDSVGGQKGVDSSMSPVPLPLQRFSRQYCAVCMLKRPERAKHCRQCNRSLPGPPLMKVQLFSCMTLPSALHSQVLPAIRPPLPMVRASGYLRCDRVHWMPHFVCMSCRVGNCVGSGNHRAYLTFVFLATCTSVLWIAIFLLFCATAHGSVLEGLWGE